MPTRFYPAESPDDFIACQRLLSALLPPHRLRALLAQFEGSLIEAVRAPLADLTTNPAIALTAKQAERVQDALRMPLPANLLTRAQTMGAWAITSRDPAYSHHLTPFPDAPPLLFLRGDLRPEDASSVAIVGSRRATVYGRTQADRFARAFAEHDLTLVSGGAAGIDTAAHQGALAVGGRTIAVLGCGVDVVYPSENRNLFDQIVTQGALISEFPLGARPEPWRFPARNRLIAGMTRATLLIETPRDSGAMITARDAAGYGRDVWAVPGPVDTGGRSRGCHLLIQDGAGLADSPDDILRALGIEVEDDEMREPIGRPAARRKTDVTNADRNDANAPQVSLPLNNEPQPIPEGLSEGETRLLAVLDGEPRHGDEAGQRAGLAASDVAVALTLLEMKGLIQRRPGNLYVRTR